MTAAPVFNFDLFGGLSGLHLLGQREQVRQKQSGEFQQDPGVNFFVIVHLMVGVIAFESEVMGPVLERRRYKMLISHFIDPRVKHPLEFRQHGLRADIQCSAKRHRTWIPHTQLDAPFSIFEGFLDTVWQMVGSRHWGRRRIVFCKNKSSCRWIAICFMQMVRELADFVAIDKNADYRAGALIASREPIPLKCGLLVTSRCNCSDSDITRTAVRT